MHRSLADSKVRSGNGLIVEHATLFSLLARLADIVAITNAACAAYWLRFDNLDLAADYQVTIIGASLLAMVFFPQFGLYQSLRGTRWVSWARRLISAWASLLLFLIFIAWATKATGGFSRLWLGYWAGLGFLFLLITHAVMMSILSALRERGWNQRRVLIAGSGNASHEVISRLEAYPWAGLKVVAAVDDNHRQQRAGIEEVKVRGYFKDIPRLVEQLKVDEVWVTLPLSESHQINRVLAYLHESMVNVRYVPDVQGLRLMNHSISDVAGLAVLNLTMSPITGINSLTKTIEDYLFGTLILLAISPLMLCIAIGIKLTSPGPVFYKQLRIGWNGRPFKMLKFRTMPVDAEEDTGPVWASKGENRATPFGQFLRKTSMDELPQFINVLKGDMSIVGPRPERPEFVSQFRHEISGYMQKHLVKAGITGWAQVNGWRGNTDLKMRIEHDLNYIENWSLSLDIKIIMMTVTNGIMNENAY
jgi:putative colanic acid biosynthesis UDP-glucose lipid carrier transferase